MRTFSFLSIAVATLGLAACSGTQATQPVVRDGSAAASSSSAVVEDHHDGETNVEPHGHSSSAAHVDDPNEPAHGHSSSHDDSNEPPHRH